MKIASIISIGTEIMKGWIDDTNSTYISRWLNSLGIKVKWRLNVADNINEIVEALDIVKNTDIVILTGGLGPTDDDCTREGLAKFLNKDLIFNSKMWKSIQQIFNKFNIIIPDSNKKQALIIPDGEFIENRSGTAPGIFYKKEDKVYILLPGPPVENQPMINNYLLKKFKDNKLLEGEIITKVLRIYNVGESELADSLAGIKTPCDLGYYFTQNGWLELHVSMYSNKKDYAANNVENTLHDIYRILSKNKYFYTIDKDISFLLLQLLKEIELTISFAESITGGSISADFVINPGASDVLLGGIVAYSDEVKENLLGVSKETLKKYGAVSEETAKEMVVGLKKEFNSDVSVSITGIAGPTGGNENKPVGLVYFGFIINDKIYVKKEVFFGKRLRIIKKSINYALIEVYKNIC